MTRPPERAGWTRPDGSALATVNVWLPGRVTRHADGMIQCGRQGVPAGLLRAFQYSSVSQIAPSRPGGGLGMMSGGGVTSGGVLAFGPRVTVPGSGLRAVFVTARPALFMPVSWTWPLSSHGSPAMSRIAITP